MVGGKEDWNVECLPYLFRQPKPECSLFFTPYNFNLSLAHQDRICQPLTLMQISIFVRGKLPHFYVCFSDVCEKNILKKSNPFYSRNWLNSNLKWWAKLLLHYLCMAHQNFALSFIFETLPFKLHRPSALTSDGREKSSCSTQSVWSRIWKVGRFKQRRVWYFHKRVTRALKIFTFYKCIFWFLWKSQVWLYSIQSFIFHNLFLVKINLYFNSLENFVDIDKVGLHR